MGPVSTSPTGRDWLGARRATSNTGELIAFNHALDWIRRRRKSLDPASPPRYNLVSDSFYCVQLFATRAIKAVALSLASMPSSTRLSPSLGLRLTQTPTTPWPKGMLKQISSRLGGVRPPTS